ncbi:MAG TPA: peptide chain release factor N(5)-glutamine methyltransferase [Flavisolibacter sp.]|nr:peptide chain release factor N(5)-glutamine methyltransferase [Flavisolibacter sp.]
MNLREAGKYITQQLAAVYDEGESAAIARLVLEDCAGGTKKHLPANDQLNIGQEAEKKIARYISRLLLHEPVQYILQKAPFYGMELYVDKSVLIPRPETEELVDWIVKDVKASGKDVFQKDDATADKTTELKVIDVGTGSGCIALALKKAMPKAEVWGCDVSEEALNVARRNGSALDIRVDFQGVDFLDEAQQKQLPSVDVIVSNPPYIPQKEIAEMSPNVTNYEPHTALFVPDDNALVFYKAIAHFAKKRLHENGNIYMEIHENLAGVVADLFTNEGYSVEVKKDMQGKDRMVKAAPSIPKG